MLENKTIKFPLIAVVVFILVLVMLGVLVGAIIFLLVRQGKPPQIQFSQEGEKGLAKEEVPYGDLNLKVSFDPETKAPTLEWREGVVIKEIEVAELKEGSPEVKRMVFKLVSIGNQDLPRPYRIGFLPEGFKVTDGNLIEKFPNGAEYKIEVIAQAQGEEFRGMTYFSL